MSVAGIVLAAGRSTRMGGPNKLLQEIGGKALVRWVAEAAVHAGLSPLVVVTGHQGEQVAEALAGLDVQLRAQPRLRGGLVDVASAGVAALGERGDGAVILLGDMPFVSAGLSSAVSSRRSRRCRAASPAFRSTRASGATRS